MKKLMSILLISITLYSCTANTRARKYGGTETIDLNEGQRLVNITWKESNLWILTKQNSNTPPTQYSFKEKSKNGVLEGEIIIKEK